MPYTCSKKIKEAWRRVQGSDLVAGWPPAAVKVTGLQTVAVQTPEKMKITDADKNVAVATTGSSCEVPFKSQ